MLFVAVGMSRLYLLLAHINKSSHQGISKYDLFVYTELRLIKRTALNPQYYSSRNLVNKFTLLSTRNTILHGNKANENLITKDVDHKTTCRTSHNFPVTTRGYKYNDEWNGLDSCPSDVQLVLCSASAAAACLTTLHFRNIITRRSRIRPPPPLPNNHPQATLRVVILR